MIQALAIFSAVAVCVAVAAIWRGRSLAARLAELVIRLQDVQKKAEELSAALSDSHAVIAAARATAWQRVEDERKAAAEAAETDRIIASGDLAAAAAALLKDFR